MRKLDSRGRINPLMPGLIISVVFLLGAIGFGIWSFMEMQTYKNDYQELVDSAVEAKREELMKEAEDEYNEREKSPYKNYVGPSQYGNVNITYPKTWAAYVNEGGGDPIEAYFHTNFVPGLETIGKTTQYALYVSVLDQAFERSLSPYASNIRAGKATSQPYAAPNVPSAVGARITAANSIVVLLPIRDKTLKLETQSPAFYADFDSIILANLTFEP
jgi:hypothetical protein